MTETIELKAIIGIKPRVFKGIAELFASTYNRVNIKKAINDLKGKISFYDWIEIKDYLKKHNIILFHNDNREFTDADSISLHISDPKYKNFSGKNLYLHVSNLKNIYGLFEMLEKNDIILRDYVILRYKNKRGRGIK